MKGSGETMTKKIYITATRPGDGKTVITLGLTAAFRRRTSSIGFIKPLGKGRAPSSDVDPDIHLIESACGLESDPSDMNPITVHTGFVEDFLRKKQADELIQQVKTSFDRVSEGKEAVVIEGTGHAAVGSIFGLSNAYVASTLQAKVLLVTSGGLGPELDEVTLNLAMFRNYGVEVLGVVLNRVGPEERDLLETVGKKALEERGIPILGVVPYRSMLESPTMREVMESTRAEVLNGESEMENRVGKVILGVSSPQRTLRELTPRSILVTAADRADLVLATLSYRLLGETDGPRISGIVLCGESHPEEEVLTLLRRTSVPVLLVDNDTYAAASCIRDIRGMIAPTDRAKIELIQDLVARHVDTDGIFDAL